MRLGRAAYEKTIGQALTVLIASALLSTPALARVSRNLTADVWLNYSATDGDSSTLENIDQEYNLAWQKNFLRDLMAKGALRYYNFGFSETAGANAWRSELQPSGEVVWNRSWLGISMQGMRRDSRSNDRTSHLINENASIGIQSRMVHYPWIKLRLQQDALYNKANLNDRDTRDRLALVSTGYAGRTSAFGYSYSYKNTLDRSQQVEQNSHNHIVQLSHVQGLGKRIRSSLSYDFTYKNQTDRNLAFDPLPLEIPLFLGLYALDASPDLGGLDTVATLIDGNSSLPVSPTIDIGNNNNGQNLGVDLGYRRELTRLYVYTDRPSGNNVRWEVYQSEDNTVWESVEGVTSRFSPGFSRYEIRFAQLASRYFKVVNQGLNEVDTVLVTEIEAILDNSESGDTRRDQQVHLASINNSIVLARSLNASVGVSLRRDGGSSLSQNRDETYYSFGLRNQMTKTIVQNARVQFGLVDYEVTRFDVDKTLAANYDLQFQPLETLGFSLSLIHRDSYIAGVKSQEINHAVVRCRGAVLPRLTIAQEFAGGRNTVMQSQTQFDSWSYRANGTGSLVSSLDLTMGYFHQHVASEGDRDRIKDQYLFGFGWELTTAIQLRGSIDYTKDDHAEYLTQDYSLSWSISEKLTTGGAVSISDYHNGIDTRSERFSAQMEYSLSRRTVITGSYGETDLGLTNGTQSRSFRVGLRTGL